MKILGGGLWIPHYLGLGTQQNILPGTPPFHRTMHDNLQPTFFLEEKHIGEECRQTGEVFVLSLFFYLLEYFFDFYIIINLLCLLRRIGAAAAADGAYSPFVDSQIFIARVLDRGEITMSFHWLVCCSGDAVKRPEFTRSYFS